MMKTAITVLQEMMIKLGQVPEYECISQTGPQHLATFDYRCRIRGVEAVGTAHSKKEAKQEAARRVLLQLSARGDAVPPPYNAQHQAQRQDQATAAVNEPERPSPQSYVALLKDLCEEYRLPAAEYELVGDTGPPHLRHFTIRARMGQHERFATATTKKAARQQAASQLYYYMRENLARLTKDFVEEDALVRAHERAMERYMEVREEVAWRPNLGLRIADYHIGLSTTIESEKCDSARSILATIGERAKSGQAKDDSEPWEMTLLASVAATLGLQVSYGRLPSGEAAIHTLELAPTSPPLAFAAPTPRGAAASALEHLTLALSLPKS